MIKAIFSTATILLLGASAPVLAQGKQVSANTSKPDVKFLDDITVEVAPVQVNTSNSAKASFLAAVSKEPLRPAAAENFTSVSIEAASQLQFKYALLLNTEVEMVKNISLYKIIDEWFGTRYRYGGTGKSGIDCSAFMQVFFSSLYNIDIPRTARQQYDFSRRISKEELKEGDLVFFNTTGGVSHVGIYLQNNKFAHAGSSEGVTISDLGDAYWLSRYLGAGRVEDLQSATAALHF